MPLTLSDLSSIMSPQTTAPDGFAAISRGLGAIGGAAQMVAQNREQRRQHADAGRRMDISELQLAESNRAAMAREEGLGLQREETLRSNRAGEAHDEADLRFRERKMVSQVWEDVSADLNSTIPELEQQAIMRLRQAGIQVNTVAEAQEALDGVEDALARTDPLDPSVEAGRPPQSLPSRAGISPSEEADRLAESYRADTMEEEALQPQARIPGQPPSLPPAGMPGISPGGMPAGLLDVPSGDAVLAAQQSPGGVSGIQSVGVQETSVGPSDENEIEIEGEDEDEIEIIDPVMPQEGGGGQAMGQTREEYLAAERSQETDWAHREALPALGPPSLSMSFRGEQLGTMQSAGQSIRDRVASGMMEFLAGTTHNRAAAADQFARLTENLTPVLGAKDALSMASELFRQRTAEEGKDRRAIVIANAKVGQGDANLETKQERLIGIGRKRADSSLKSKGFYKARKDIDVIMLGITDILSDNSVTHNRAIMNMIEAQQTGIVTDKDYANALGKRSGLDLIKSIWAGAFEGEIEEGKRIEIAEALTMLMNLRQAQIKRTYQAVKATRDARDSDGSWSSFASDFSQKGYKAKIDEEYSRYEWYQQARILEFEEQWGTGYSVDEDPTPGGAADRGRTSQQRVDHARLESRRVPGSALQRANKLLRKKD